MLDRGPRFKGGATGIAGVHLHQHIARVFELFVKVTKRVDDDRAFAFGAVPVRAGAMADAAAAIEAKLADGDAAGALSAAGDL